MKYEINDAAGSTVLSVSGEMTVSDRDIFGGLLPSLCRPGNRSVVVDMKDLEYMDSAGLGMLLTLREEATKQGAVVSIRHPEGEVREMLDLARFDTLFAIEHRHR